MVDLVLKVSLPNFATAKILVIGDIMLDRYWHGGTSRISPEAPVPVVNVHDTEDRAGGAANVALNIAALGSQVTLCGISGDDEAANSLEKLLSLRGVHCAFERRNHQNTITKLRVISRNQQLIRLDFEKDFSLQNGLSINSVEQLIGEHDILVLSDYGKGTLQDPQSLIQVALKAGKKVIVDPKGSDFSKYAHATVITPNQSEFDLIAGSSKDEQEFFDKAQQLRQQLGLTALLVTRSEKGMALFEQQHKPFIQPTQAREVYDVTGAGDTVVASLAAALSSGVSLSEATQIANLAAGVVVGKLGTASVNQQELQQAMFKQQPLTQGVVDEHELVNLIIKAKGSGETIVMTNGCFDILHAGHVSYLTQAADLGDKLIVAVNDDQSVKRLKGNSRPVNPLSQRMQVLAGLASVDWVVSFSEDTPARLIGNCLPDILVKGGDYAPEQIAGGQAVTDNGGQVIILDFVDGISTTKIIEKAKS
ncbi:MAG: bifunctional D-glycero-beta-D-manno-heptose-7-phosphate kinase/D-glycero-beta-D-manno-heptose 1-phosphate adenylyltransferase HldE [Kangiellaceae bacterium]|nr:bifunctional D-glycero-beta-D-manno-heptose-7-phosphate kinase/D-glycero-beta-D-manno-heptose 1-phosphate adenylyltransferase HldE [Kangiellaceae bacterium]